MLGYKILGFTLFTSLFITNAYAGIIAVGTISADATPAGFNNNFTIITNGINGQIQGSGTTGSTTNILADSLGELDMSDEINPRVRDGELLNITVDSTTSQLAFVATGLTPATSASLTSNISTGTAYINGYRVNKSATSETYTASRDTYVDLSQGGAFTLSAVANGAAAPAVAANSARLAKVITSGTAITSVVDLANRILPGLVIAKNYRNGLYVSRDSTTTITIFPGSTEINSTLVTKTSTTTLTLNTASDWAGGSSLQATSTYGYVGMDTSGNLKMHTTAPTNDNYGLTTSSGRKRYVSWASTVYRVLGWFYMNATGSGQLNTYEVGNIRDSGTPNTTTLSSTISVSSGSATLVNDTEALVHFYSSGGPLQIIYDTRVGNSGVNRDFIQLSVDSAGLAVGDAEGFANTSGGTAEIKALQTTYNNTVSEGTHTIQGQFRDVNGGGTASVNRRQVITTEK